MTETIAWAIKGPAPGITGLAVAITGLRWAITAAGVRLALAAPQRESPARLALLGIRWNHDPVGSEGAL